MWQYSDNSSRWSGTYWMTGESLLSIRWSSYDNILIIILIPVNSSSWCSLDRMTGASLLSTLSPVASLSVISLDRCRAGNHRRGKTFCQSGSLWNTFDLPCMAMEKPFYKIFSVHLKKIDTFLKSTGIVYFKCKNQIDQFTSSPCINVFGMKTDTWFVENLNLRSSIAVVFFLESHHLALIFSPNKLPSSNPNIDKV